MTSLTIIKELSLLTGLTTLGRQENVSEFYNVECYDSLRIVSISDVLLQLSLEWSYDGLEPTPGIKLLEDTYRTPAVIWKTSSHKVQLPFCRLRVLNSTGRENNYLNVLVFPDGLNEVYMRKWTDKVEKQKSRQFEKDKKAELLKQEELAKKAEADKQAKEAKKLERERQLEKNRQAEIIKIIDQIRNTEIARYTDLTKQLEANHRAEVARLNEQIETEKAKRKRFIFGKSKRNSTLKNINSPTSLLEPSTIYEESIPAVSIIQHDHEEQHTHIDDTINDFILKDDKKAEKEEVKEEKVDIINFNEQNHEIPKISIPAEDKTQQSPRFVDSSRPHFLKTPRDVKQPILDYRLPAFIPLGSILIGGPDNRLILLPKGETGDYLGIDKYGKVRWISPSENLPPLNIKLSTPNSHLPIPDTHLTKSRSSPLDEY